MATPLQRDPSRTITLRKRFIADMNKRVRKLNRLVFEFMVTLDALGLKPSTPGVPGLVANIEPGEFAFRTDAGKIDAFNKWFQEQIDLGILEVDPINGDPWTAKYVDSAYKKGAVRAFTDTRKELDDQADFIKGKQAEFLAGSFAAPETVQKIRAISTRVFEELKGVSATMSQQISRNLADGLSQGLGPREIARNMANSITGISRTRALVLARTEVVRAHAEGQLDAFEELNVDRLGIMQEFSTAGDDRVCPRCEVLDGTVFTVQEARGIIPRHPNCRCAFIPAGVGEVATKPRATTKEQVEARVEASLKAELPKKAKDKSLKAAKEKSTNPLRSLKVGARTGAQKRRLGEGSSVIPRPSVARRRAATIAKKKKAAKKKPKPKSKLEKDKVALAKLKAENKKKAKELKDTQARTAKLKRDLKVLDDKEKGDKKEIESLNKKVKEKKVEIKQVESDTTRLTKALALEDKGGPSASIVAKQIKAEQVAREKAAKKPTLPPSNDKARVEARLKKQNEKKLEEEAKLKKQADAVAKLNKKGKKEQPKKKFAGKKFKENDTVSMNNFMEPTFKDHRNKLTIKQQIDIREYGGQLSADVNDFLNEGLIERGITKGQLKEVIKSMDKAVKTSPGLPSDMLVHRGYRSKDVLEKALNSTGSIFTDKGYSSTSLDSGVADNFAREVIARVELKKGQKGIWLGGDLSEALGDVEGESEFILPRNTSFRITKQRINSDNVIEITMEVVDE